MGKHGRREKAVRVESGTFATRDSEGGRDAEREEWVVSRKAVGGDDDDDEKTLYDAVEAVLDESNGTYMQIGEGGVSRRKGCLDRCRRLNNNDARTFCQGYPTWDMEKIGHLELVECTPPQVVGGGGNPNMGGRRTKNDAVNAVEKREDADIGAVEKSRAGAAARVGGLVGRVAIKKGRFRRDLNPGREDQNLEC